MTKPTDAEIAAVNPKPRVLPEDLDNQVKDVTYKQFDLLTVCVITMQNGFLVSGESACAYAENFNEEIGQRIAFENAKEKMWLLLGYELKSKVHAEQNPVVTTPLDRVVIEAAELQDKIDKLTAFMKPPMFYKGGIQNLNPIQQDLLAEQLKAMITYHNILDARIQNW